ncbi:MAG: threonine synthase [bacterium]|jgi:threonine synthase
MSFVSHLECPKCQKSYSTQEIQHLCGCGSPLLARYDLEQVKKVMTKEALKSRAANMWRYLELLPVSDPVQIITLGEGFTPMLKVDNLAAEYGLENLWIKDEGLNPTGSFKARGAAAGVTKAKELGVKAVAMPTAGNAGGAWSCYAAKAGMQAFIAIPQDAPAINKKECLAAGAELFLIDGLISDAGKFIGKGVKELGWYDAATLKEPYRIEGKKTMGFEIAEQFNWDLPDVVLYPCGGGVGLIGMWKAFDELEAIGWISGKRPRLVAVQASGCAPIVKAYEEGREDSDFWTGAETLADGIRVPKALGDFLVLKAIKETNGAAIAVTDDEIMAAKKLVGRKEGQVISPEGAAAVAAVDKMVQQGQIGRDERVVIFNTGSGLKYPELIEIDLPVYQPTEEDWLQKYR